MPPLKPASFDQTFPAASVYAVVCAASTAQPVRQRGGGLRGVSSNAETIALSFSAVNVRFSRRRPR